MGSEDMLSELLSFPVIHKLHAGAVRRRADPKYWWLAGEIKGFARFTSSYDLKTGVSRLCFRPSVQVLICS